jgi:hypothetical protein
MPDVNLLSLAGSVDPVGGAVLHACGRVALPYRSLRKEAPITGLSALPDRRVPTYPGQTEEGRQ